MGKIYAKLLIISLALLLSVSVVVMSTYAWLVMSSSPVVSGIQVTIGGGNTILVAPDLQQEVDGNTYHYPGGFSDKLNFSQHESYAYLQDVAGLSPVSTADGVHWFLPSYYDNTDEEVQNGTVLNGALRDISDFLMDDQLAHANLDRSETEKIEAGSYSYLDFWVVSPGADYTLRISAPTADSGENGGSFVMDLPRPEQQDETWVLSGQEHSAAAAVRVGFLANANRVTDDSMVYYQSSSDFDERYMSLLGLYSEPDSAPYTQGNRFTIYEPNADSHPEMTAALGSYVTTHPITLVNGVASEVSVSDRLTVQKTSRWLGAQNDGERTVIEQIFHAATMGMNLDGMEPGDVADAFFNDHLQGQIASYIQKGEFITRTSDLYKFGATATAGELDTLDTAGATDDVYIIKLERNVPQRIRMFVWLEGQDVDCIDSVRASSFVVNIEFAGGTE